MAHLPVLFVGFRTVRICWCCCFVCAVLWVHCCYLDDGGRVCVSVYVCAKSRCVHNVAHFAPRVSQLSRSAHRPYCVDLGVCMRARVRACMRAQRQIWCAGSSSLIDYRRQHATGFQCRRSLLALQARGPPHGCIEQISMICACAFASMYACMHAITLAPFRR